MICVCHRCGKDLFPENCEVCLGPCQQLTCPVCGGHRCHDCTAAHLREDRIIALRRSDPQGKLTLTPSLRQPAA